ncbi:MAG TPA: alpha/beta hydrolase [Rhodanobacteraceae bacterium]|nr:alpha/beta hydrolase [Rhodanobacteraceae bacterium]
MSLRFLLASAWLALAGIAHAQDAVPVQRSDGALTPLMVYEPAQASGCPPLALLSPGAGGDQSGLRYLGEALRADGWRAIVIGHRESGMAPLKRDIRNARGIHGGVAELVNDTAAYNARFMDIDAARSWAQSRCRAPFTALLGHSMGARTVLIEAGARNKLGVHAEGGFDAYVALSPAGPDQVFPPAAERGIRTPMLMITGTRDSGLDGDYRWRTRAFEALPAGGCDRLVIVDGATHMNFAGVGFARKTKNAVVPLVTSWLDGLRAHQCAAAPSLAGVRVTTK